MKQWISIIRRNLSNSIIPVTLLIFGFVFFSVPTRGDELTGSAPGYTSDQTPPQITVISPLPDSVVDTEAPLIEVTFMDAGSDIDLDSIRLLMDRMDVTAPAVERLDGAEPATPGSYKISYQPSASLKPGIHEIDFSVRDQAGNLAEVHWNFEVKITVTWGFRASGGYTFQFDLLSPYKSVNMLDLTLQGQARDTDVQLHLFGWADTPYSQESNYHLDSYSLGIYHQRFGLVLGYTGISLDSELLQNSLDKGWVAGNTVGVEAGEYNWVAFAGSTGTNSGIAGINKIEGVIGRWAPTVGWGLGGFGLRLEGDGVGADFMDVKGNSPLGKPFQLRYELIHGDSWGDSAGTVGNAGVFHLDKYIGPSVFGLDYMIFEGDFPAFGVNPLLNTGAGGVHKYNIRYNTPFPKGQSLNVDSSFTADNLDGSSGETNWWENVNLGYAWNPGPAFSYNATYQWAYSHQINKVGVTHYLTNGLTNNLNFNKTIGKSTLQSSLSLGQTWEPFTDRSSNYVTFSGAWTTPVGPPIDSAQTVMAKPKGVQSLGGFNLIPTVNWTVQNLIDGYRIDGGEFRVTLDGQLLPESSRSSWALFRRISNNTQNQTFETGTGIATTVFAKTWGNSNLMISFSYSFWTKDEPAGAGFSHGFSRGFSLVWRSYF